MWKTINASTIKWNKKLPNIIIKIDMIEYNNIESKKR